MNAFAFLFSLKRRPKPPRQTHSINRMGIFFYKHTAVDVQINLCHFEVVMIAWHKKYGAIKIIRHVPFAFLMLNIFIFLMYWPVSMEVLTANTFNIHTSPIQHTHIQPQCPVSLHSNVSVSTYSFKKKYLFFPLSQLSVTNKAVLGKLQ